MKIIWDQVTTFSQFVALVVFLLVFCVGFIVGSKYENEIILGLPNAKVIYECKSGHRIRVNYFENMARVKMDNRGEVYLTQTVSASGARFENKLQNLVFWNKGDNAFVMENDKIIQNFEDCSIGSN